MDTLQTVQIIAEEVTAAVLSKINPRLASFEQRLAQLEARSASTPAGSNGALQSAIDGLRRNLDELQQGLTSPSTLLESVAEALGQLASTSTPGRTATSTTTDLRDLVIQVFPSIEKDEVNDDLIDRLKPEANPQAWLERERAEKLTQLKAIAPVGASDDSLRILAEMAVANDMDVNVLAASLLRQSAAPPKGGGPKQQSYRLVMCDVCNHRHRVRPDQTVQAVCPMQKNP
jgi:hypothetical protein